MYLQKRNVPKRFFATEKYSWHAFVRKSQFVAPVFGPRTNLAHLWPEFAFEYLDPQNPLFAACIGPKISGHFYRGLLDPKVRFNFFV